MFHMKTFAFQKRLFILLLLQDIVDWVLITLSTLVSSNQAWVRRWATEHAHGFRRISPWCDANQYAYCTTRARIRANSMLLGRNICSLLSFFNWLVATNRRSITLLDTHRIHFLNVLYPTLAETVKVFLQVSQSFFHKFKCLSLQSCPKVFIRFLCGGLVIFSNGTCKA